MKMTIGLNSVLLSATLLVALSPEGYCLMCHTCYSTESWNDCLKNSRPENCSTLGSSESVCLTVLNSKLYVTNQQVNAFAKACWQKSKCSNEVCRYESVKDNERGVIKATYCDVDCCIGDLCNSGTTGFNQKSKGSFYNAGTPSNFYLIIFALVISMFK